MFVRHSPIRETPRTTGGILEAILRVMAAGEWQVYVANEVRDWLDGLDLATHARVVQAIDTLADAGPGLGRPLVDTIHGSTIANLKELRPGTVRILLVAGDKAGQ